MIRVDTIKSIEGVQIILTTFPLCVYSYKVKRIEANFQPNETTSHTRAIGGVILKMLSFMLMHLKSFRFKKRWTNANLLP